MDRAVAFRQMVKDQAGKQGVSFTLMPIMIKAASLALARYPILNASLSADQASIIYKARNLFVLTFRVLTGTMQASHNIGIAVDTPNGLVVPNIKNVQNMSLMEIAAELNRLQAAAAKNQLGMSDLSGGTFTLSNVGVIGGTYTSPVIVPPEVCIGAIGRMRKEPRFDSANRGMLSCFLCSAADAD